ncbi:hypothetical protein [Pseudomonas sp. OHS18]|uniref:hypothetical protein n=1 Tax=Pseudomonas sp. OHS18 TaxID=3399679 RepID=UPI003A897A23
MPKRPAITEVYLQPGGYHFGGPYTRVRTLLGSCVSIVLWHPGHAWAVCAISSCPPVGGPAPSETGATAMKS